MAPEKYKWEDRMLSEEKLQEHIARYFRAMHGKQYVYQAPETYPNALERWMLYVSGGHEEMAEKEIKNIEDWAERQKVAATIEWSKNRGKPIKKKSPTWGPWGEEGRQGN